MIQKEKSTMLNPQLDVDTLAALFRAEDRVRVENVLDPEVAKRVQEYCLTEVPFELAHFRNGKNHSWGADDVAGKTQEELLEIQNEIWADARNGVGFQYGSYRMRRAVKNSANEKLRYLHSVFDYLNSDEMLQFVRAVTGRNKIKSADAHYTRYISGQFLTRHRDVVEGKGRLIGYVLGFNDDWHPDWGGLLQFYEEDGTPKDAWTPQFNCMNLFDIHHIHAVTYVTPFAGAPRLSLTGWFRSTPPDTD
jgi:Rps23 Pro-64 3,4-dihydroxylase Tpa1-like proline 4-hydroxylase